MSPEDDGPLGWRVDPEGDGDPDAAARRREEELARWAHRQDPDEERRLDAPRDGGPARLPAGASRYGWFVGVVGVLVIVVAMLNAIRTEGPGSTGLDPGSSTSTVPAFAAPLATSDLEGDVNVARRAGEGEAGEVPACSVRGADVLNVCELYEQGPVVLVFMADRGGRCVREVDVVDDVARRFPDVRFAAVAIRGDRQDLARLVRERRWRIPVGYDADGITANLYGVAVCPHLTFIRKGGRVESNAFGELGEAELVARVERLRGS